MTPGQPPIDRWMLDDVPCFGITVPGPTRVALMFRVGVLDESPTNAGITHACEHMALRPFTGARYAFNGSVSSLFTSFTCEGSPEETSSFLDRLTATMGRPDPEDWSAERRVLRAEDYSLGGHLMGLHTGLRWGLRGTGVRAAEATVLSTLTTQQLTTWGLAWFTSGNACLAVTGPEPRAAALRLILPLGGHHAVPALATGVIPQLPACTSDRVPGPSVSAVIYDSPECNAAVAILRQRLEDRLRHQQGLVYSVDFAREPVGTWELHVLIATQVERRDRGQVTHLFAETLSAAATAAVDPAELDQVLDRRLRAAQDPAAWGTHVVAAAQQQLIGRGDAPPATLEGVAAALKMFTASALLIAPPEADRPGPPFTPLTAVRHDAVQGTTWRSTTGSTITTNHEGLLHQEGQSTTWIAWTTATVVRQTDGGRQVVGDDGHRVVIGPALWRKGDALVSLVDERVPRSQQMTPGSGLPGHSVLATPTRSPRRVSSRPAWNAWMLGIWGALILLRTLTSHDRAHASSAYSNGAKLADAAAVAMLGWAIWWFWTYRRH